MRRRRGTEVLGPRCGRLVDGSLHFGSGNGQEPRPSGFHLARRTKGSTLREGKCVLCSGCGSGNPSSVHGHRRLLLAHTIAPSRASSRSRVARQSSFFAPDGAPDPQLSLSAFVPRPLKTWNMELLHEVWRQRFSLSAVAGGSVLWSRQYSFLRHSCSLEPQTHSQRICSAPPGLRPTPLLLMELLSMMC